MSILKFSLTFNSLFSIVIGLLLVSQSYEVSQLFGVQADMFFSILGYNLFAFAMAVFYIGWKKPVRPLPVFIVIILDALWVIVSLIILLTNPFEITEIGNNYVAGVALVVLTVGTLQSIGLSKIDLNTETGHKTLKFKRIVSAEKERVWETISDVANYHNFAPNIDDVQIVSGNGEGMIRKCSKGNGSWTEECVTWDEGKKFSFRVNTDRQDYPFPLKFLQGTWMVSTENPNKTNIEMLFEFRYKKKFMNLLLHPLMAPKFNSIVEELLDNWENKLKSEV